MRKKKDPKNNITDLNSKEVLEIISKNIYLLFKNRLSENEKERMIWLGQACFGDGMIMESNRMIERFSRVCNQLAEQNEIIRRLEKYLIRLVRTEGKA